MACVAGLQQVVGQYEIREQLPSGIISNQTDVTPLGGGKYRPHERTVIRDEVRRAFAVSAGRQAKSEIRPVPPEGRTH